MAIDRIKKEKEYIKKYNLIDFMKYDSYFNIEIRIRGDRVYKNNKIKDYSYDKNIASCKIEGTEIYDVSIEFDNKNNIINTHCTCPYCEKGNNCKHMYALLIKSKLEDNYEKLVNIQKKSFEEYLNIFKNCKEYFKDNIKKYSKSGIEEINNFISYYENNRISRFNIILNRNLNQIGYLCTIIEVQEGKQRMVEDFKKVRELELEYEIEEDNVVTNNRTSLSDKIYRNRRKIYFGSFLYGLVKGFKNATSGKGKKKNYSDYSEKEMDDYGLEEWQKEEVRQGNYDPWNFDEHDYLEEDDYYYGEDE